MESRTMRICEQYTMMIRLLTCLWTTARTSSNASVFLAKMPASLTSKSASLRLINLPQHHWLSNLDDFFDQMVANNGERVRSREFWDSMDQVQDIRSLRDEWVPKWTVSSSFYDELSNFLIIRNSVDARSSTITSSITRRPSRTSLFEESLQPGERRASHSRF